MPRNIFEKMERAEVEKSEKKEYTAPEHELMEIEITNKLIEHYLNEKDDKSLFDLGKFASEVLTLESMMEEARGKFEPQPVIDALRVLLKNEPDGRDFSRIDYLCAVVQALYNLGYWNKFVIDTYLPNYTTEFAIDMRDWPKNDTGVGWFLAGRPDKPLTLRVYGEVPSCADFATNSHFIVYDKVNVCGVGTKNCKFTLYDTVVNCGYEARNSTFDLMPDAEIKRYHATIFEGNKLRRLNEKGEVMIMPTLWLNMYHNVKSIFLRVKLNYRMKSILGR